MLLHMLVFYIHLPGEPFSILMLFCFMCISYKQHIAGIWIFHLNQSLLLLQREYNPFIFIFDYLYIWTCSYHVISCFLLTMFLVFSSFLICFGMIVVLCLSLAHWLTSVLCFSLQMVWFYSSATMVLKLFCSHGP